eukprot:TRINITY_DN452_c0_g2_i1.p1 TRINITY_DN452_c0_g2~~TRINITY_DN452_c0_g2_i1.p1  ORF type:complete len:562 (+),score=122.74 TRINITY_DN452_c0_g2_i1:294-1979(+)
MIQNFFRKKGGHLRKSSHNIPKEEANENHNDLNVLKSSKENEQGAEFPSWGGVGLPFNVQKKLHIDQSMNWGADPKEAFELIEKLGEGAFGVVFKAKLKETGFILAVKIMDVGDEKDDVMKEIKMLKCCQHRNIVSYFGSCVQDEKLWILMDYCGAGSVRDVIESVEKTFNEEQIAHICADTLKGLAYLHKSSIIHRDIKAANILLTDYGEAKLADFGVSEQLTSTITKRNTIIGTPLWMSPEVIQGKGYNSKADVWSLGITAIEMAEGLPPNAEMHPMRAIFLIPMQPPPTLAEPTDWSREFNDFLTKCLVKNPEDRASAEELLNHPFIKGAKGPAVMIDLILERQRIKSQPKPKKKKIETLYTSGQHDSRVVSRSSSTVQLSEVASGTVVIQNESDDDVNTVLVNSNSSLDGKESDDDEITGTTVFVNEDQPEPKPHRSVVKSKSTPHTSGTTVFSNTQEMTPSYSAAVSSSQAGVARVPAVAPIHKHAPLKAQGFQTPKHQVSIGTQTDDSLRRPPLFDWKLLIHLVFLIMSIGFLFVYQQENNQEQPNVPNLKPLLG